ncbi:uncharacterized protein RJT20DRAFT_130799 [Scheffersomyces xylosifermentans]|uniref:uncharacterized protein n=1 Tax=Scheffersomyces xylosifermentans TaxID=1304137 RepID=UPI00315D52C6
MKGDIRRCRRCKRKRLEDEPLEVRQYKTCAKCRIIERNKKNSRKPLAEETMLYGLKQFREQSSSDNFLEEEGLLNDEFFRRFHNKPFNYEAELQEILNNPNYVSPVLNPPAEVEPASQRHYTFKSATIPIAGFSPTPAPAASSHQPQVQTAKIQQYQAPKHSKPNPSVSMPLDNIRQYKPKQRTDFNNVYGEVESKEEDIFVELAKLGNRSELTIASTADAKDIDPYLYGNVYDDFQSFLLKVLDKREKREDVVNLVYLKEFNEEFTNNLGRYDSTLTSKENNSALSARFGEKQLRTHLLNNLKSLYVESVIAMMGIPYNQESSNLLDFKSSNSIKSIHTFNYHDTGKVDTHNDFIKIKNSTIYMSFNRRYNLLIIKINHITYKPSGRVYSEELKQKVVDIYKKLQYERTLPPPPSTPNLHNGTLDYNAFTATLVYDKLFAVYDMLTEDSQNILKSVSKDEFIGDFVNFTTVFKLNEESPEDNDEEMEEADQDEEDEEDEEEEDDDDDDDEEDEEEEEEEIPSEDELEDGITYVNGTSVPTVVPGAEGSSADNAPPKVDPVPLSAPPTNSVPVSQPAPLQLQNKALEEVSRPETKESTAELLDPVLKPE